MPMMHVDIPKPGIDIPVYPTGALALPEPAEGWTAEEILKEGIENGSRCCDCSTRDNPCLFDSNAKPGDHTDTNGYYKKKAVAHHN